jgi:hypothetical protein
MEVRDTVTVGVIDATNVGVREILLAASVLEGTADGVIKC